MLYMQFIDKAVPTPVTGQNILTLNPQQEDTLFTALEERGVFEEISLLRRPVQMTNRQVWNALRDLGYKYCVRNKGEGRQSQWISLGEFVARASSV